MVLPRRRHAQVDRAPGGAHPGSEPLGARRCIRGGGSGGRPLEEEELIKRARGGDTAAYSVLVKKYQEVAFRTAYMVAGATGDAEDAAQEAFLKAYQALGRFRRGASFRPWLLAIVVNEARNRVRSAARRTDLQLRMEGSAGPDQEAPSPEAAAIAVEERERVLAGLNGLEPNDRLVIALRYLLDMSEREMAEVLDCRTGTVKSRLSRAMAKLRNRMRVEVSDA